MGSREKIISCLEGSLCESKSKPKSMEKNCPSKKELINYNCCDKPMKILEACEAYNNGKCKLNGEICNHYN